MALRIVVVGPKNGREPFVVGEGFAVANERIRMDLDIDSTSASHTPVLRPRFAPAPGR